MVQTPAMTLGTSGSTGVTAPGRARITEPTLRTDRWWLPPLLTFVAFTAFVVYATWRAFSGAHYYATPYLSPFYSPCLGDCVEGASDFGQPFDWWPFSAALLDRKSTRLNSSHANISYAVFCLKKKNT